MICASCRTPAGPDQRFCRSCGTALTRPGRLARPSRAASLPTDDEPTLVRDVAAVPDAGAGSASLWTPAAPSGSDAGPGSPGTLDAARAAGPPCAMCGAPAGGRRLCVDCEVTAHAEIPPTDPPAAQEPGAPRKRSSGRRARLALLAMLIVLAGAVAAIAVARHATRDDAPPARSAPSGPPAARTAPRPAGAPAPDPAATQPVPGRVEDLDRPEAHGGASPPRAARPATAETGPERALEEHWRAIGRGQLATAYDRFSTSYRKGHSIEDWSTGMRGYAPDVRILEIRQIAASGDRATVRVALVTRDRGSLGDDSRCHIFSGSVRVVRERGRWLYDPPGLHELHKGGIDPASDERCAPLFR